MIPFKLGSLSSFAGVLKVGIYSQIGSVNEFCHVNSAYIFVDGTRVKSNANLGKIFKLDVPEGAKLLIRDASMGRNLDECDKIVLQKENGLEIKAQRTLGTINFEIQL